MKFSINKKLNQVLSTIYDELLNIHDNQNDSISEIKHYKNDFPKEIDYNLAQYGNLRVYYDDVKELYKDYKSVARLSNQRIWDIYKRQVGYVARFYF